MSITAPTQRSALTRDDKTSKFAMNVQIARQTQLPAALYLRAVMFITLVPFVQRYHSAGTQGNPAHDHNAGAIRSKSITAPTRSALTQDDKTSKIAILACINKV